MYDGHMYGFFGGFMWLFWLLVIGLIIWAIKGVASSGSPGTQSAREILEERYARGEIDREEFEQKRKDLGV